MLQTLAPALVRAGSWYLRSGIQEADGGVARYHLLAENRNLPVSTEITGYACSAFTYLWQRTGDAAYAAAARRAARFLTSTAWQPELAAMPFELGTPLPPAYFFDCGIIVRGLLALHRTDPDPALLAAAREIGLFMGRAFRRDGVIAPIVALPSLEPFPFEPRWSREPGCFQLKSAMAWDNLAAYFPDDPFSGWYEETLSYSLATWTTFLPGAGEPARIMDRLHAHGYFLEGMLPRAYRPEVRETLAAAIARTGEWLRRVAPGIERSDVCAQLLRARLYAHHHAAVPLDYDAAADEAARCERHQRSGGSAMLADGFGFGTRDGQPLPYMNPVSTAFCMQALEQWRQFQSGEFHGDLLELI